MILSCCFNILLYWYVFDFLFMTLKWRSGSILIERTFLKPHNTNAHLHLVRTRRPWYQFLNHCDALCLGRVIESLSAIQYLSKTWWFLLGCYWNTSYTLSLLGRIPSSFEMLITTEMFDLFSIVHIHVLISFLLQIFV